MQSVLALRAQRSLRLCRAPCCSRSARADACLGGDSTLAAPSGGNNNAYCPGRPDLLGSDCVRHPLPGCSIPSGGRGRGLRVAPRRARPGSDAPRTDHIGPHQHRLNRYFLCQSDLAFLSSWHQGLCGGVRGSRVHQINHEARINHDLSSKRAPRRACVSPRLQVSRSRGEENSRGCRSAMKGPDGDEEVCGREAGTAGTGRMASCGRTRSRRRRRRPPGSGGPVSSLASRRRGPRGTHHPSGQVPHVTEGGGLGGPGRAGAAAAWCRPRRQSGTGTVLARDLHHPPPLRVAPR